jgi:hypothetical protein
MRSIFESSSRLETHTIIHKSQSLPYGEVLSGHLWLSRRVQQAYGDDNSLRRNSTSSQFFPLRVYWDLSNSVDPQSVWCLEIIGSYISVGLILGSNDQVEFERLGYFEVDGRLSYGEVNGFHRLCQLAKDWFGEVEQHTIVLH